MNRNSRRSDCPIHCTLNLLGDRWTLIIVRDLLTSDRATFSELLDSSERIATNTLSSRLASLVAQGIIEQFPGDKRYFLTEKGLDLAPILAELTIWGMRHDPTAYSPAVDWEEYHKHPQQFIEQIKNTAREKRREH